MQLSFIGQVRVSCKLPSAVAKRDHEVQGHPRDFAHIQRFSGVEGIKNRVEGDFESRQPGFGRLPTFLLNIP